MNLPAIFSLIFAALLSLMPVLLLMGRRAAQSRLRDAGEEPKGRGETKPLHGSNRPAAAGEPERPRVAREIYTRGQGRATPERDLRDAARIAGMPMGRVGVAGRKSKQPVRAPRSTPISARLSRLGPLQQAVVYSEILGRPVALREPGRGESL